MSEDKEEQGLSSWMSTYGMITAERILGHFKLRLLHQELHTAMKNTRAFYHQILQLPLKNIFNGIILQQAYDYEVYAQKLFIDYLVSGESSKPEEAPGGYTREEIEKERKQLIAMADEFRDNQDSHYRLIAESQAAIITKTQEWLKALSKAVDQITSSLKSHSLKKEKLVIENALNALLVHPEVIGSSKVNLDGSVWTRVEQIWGEKLSTSTKQILVDNLSELIHLSDSNNSFVEFSGQIKDMGQGMRAWRTAFYELILRTNELLKLLPEYQINQVQAQENKASLHFDSEIGEK